jgi:hypothetical protein
MLSWGAWGALGFDIDPDAIEFAWRHFPAPNLTYSVKDVCTDWLPQADFYVAFELLEHLREPQELLARIPGPLLWSMPIENSSPFHRKVYEKQEIEELMEGSTFYPQAGDGTILPEGRTKFELGYMLGIRQA